MCKAVGSLHRNGLALWVTECQNVNVKYDSIIYYSGGKQLNVGIAHISSQNKRTIFSF